jgi:hypothetical protein
MSNARDDKYGTPRTDALATSGGYLYDEVVPADLARKLERELAEAREILAGGDAASLPNDYPLPRMASDRMKEIAAAEDRYLSAVRGRADFRKAYRDERAARSANGPMHAAFHAGSLMGHVRWLEERYPDAKVTVDDLKKHIQALYDAATQSSTVPIMAWLHAEHGNAYVITDRVKDLWKQVDPRHVDNYTVPLYAAPVATPVAAALKDPEWESGPYFYGDPYGWPWPYTAWLIETGSPALYWHSGGTGDGGYIETWKDDAHKALKFRTEENARREMERLVGFGVTKPMRVCGHTFQCGSTPHSAIGARWVLISRAEAHRLVKEDGAIQLMDGNVPFVRQRSMGKEWFRLEAPPLPDKAVDSKAER